MFTVETSYIIDKQEEEIKISHNLTSEVTITILGVYEADSTCIFFKAFNTLS